MSAAKAIPNIKTFELLVDFALTTSDEECFESVFRCWRCDETMALYIFTIYVKSKNKTILLLNLHKELFSINYKAIQ